MSLIKYLCPRAKRGEMEENMKETKLFITLEEIVETTGMSMAYAYKLIKRLNSELEAKGFVTI